jgi:hypothetical protein
VGRTQEDHLLDTAQNLELSGPGRWAQADTRLRWGSLWVDSPSVLAAGSVVVPVALVCGVSMTIVKVVDVISMGHGHMAASLTVLMGMPVVNLVPLGLALIEVTVMGSMQVTVVGVVEVLAVRDRHMATAFSMPVVVVLVSAVISGCHPGLPLRAQDVSTGKYPVRECENHMACRDGHQRACTWVLDRAGRPHRVRRSG